MTPLLVLAGCPKPPPPPGANEAPRLAAVEVCASNVDLATAALPVPPRPPADPYALSSAAAMFVHDAEPGWNHPVTMICDLPDRILGIAAEQGVVSGKRRIGGSVFEIPRAVTVPRVPPHAITPDSPGCVDGVLTCAWKTASLRTIETIPRQAVSTSGWVHGLDDMCRALPDDTIATCSTVQRLAYIELGCQSGDGAQVALQLGLHDTSLERRYDLDIEVPVGRLYGAVETATDPRYVYRFTGPGDAKGRFKSATLSFDLAAKSATLELDGVREPCLAFGLHRR